MIAGWRLFLFSRHKAGDTMMTKKIKLAVTDDETHRSAADQDWEERCKNQQANMESRWFEMQQTS
jgi:hypothetical protein